MKTSIGPGDATDEERASKRGVEEDEAGGGCGDEWCKEKCCGQIGACYRASRRISASLETSDAGWKQTRGREGGGGGCYSSTRVYPSSSASLTTPPRGSRIFFPPMSTSQTGLVRLSVRFSSFQCRQQSGTSNLLENCASLRDAGTSPLRTYTGKGTPIRLRGEGGDGKVERTCSHSCRGTGGESLSRAAVQLAHVSVYVINSSCVPRVASTCVATDVSSAASHTLHIAHVCVQHRVG